MHRQNRKNDGLDHYMPIPLNQNKNNGGNNAPCNGPYNNQIYTGIPQGLSSDMGNADPNRDMRSLNSPNCGVPGGTLPNGNGMGGYPQSPIPGMQPMQYNGYQQMNQRPWVAVGPMCPPGSFPVPPGVYPYGPVPSPYPPMYPPNPYGGGMAWNSPVVAPSMPVDGSYQGFNGEDFKILGYGGPNTEDPTDMNFQNQPNPGNVNSGRVARMR